MLSISSLAEPRSTSTSSPIAPSFLRALKYGWRSLRSHRFYSAMLKFSLFSALPALENEPHELVELLNIIGLALDSSMFKIDLTGLFKCFVSTKLRRRHLDSLSCMYSPHKIVVGAATHF